MSKRVFVIRGGGKSDFEEAIFVLKEGAGLSDAEFLAEAEALAGDFRTASAPKRKTALPWLAAGTAGGLLILSWILFFVLF